MPPTLVIAGQYNPWSDPEDREGLMRDLVRSPVKPSALIPDATHFVLFEKNRFPFFDAILKFLKEWSELGLRPPSASLAEARPPGHSPIWK